MSVRPLLSGLASYTPLWALRKQGTRGTDSSRYCYSVWFRHLLLAREHGLPLWPKIIAEIGPGDSLGTGVAGLLAGASKYYAFDVVRYSSLQRNLAIFKELSELYRKHADIPDEHEFPKVKPTLRSYRFPSDLLSESYLDECLRQDRLAAIKNSLLYLDLPEPPSGPIEIRYFVPWDDPEIVQKESVDMIFSQAVLEYVENLDWTYQTLFEWLKPGGWMSHQIDLGCGGTASSWNDHWAHSDLIWRIIKGRKRHSINRLPHFAHISAQKKAGFKIIADIQLRDASGIKKEDLAKRFKHLSDDDLLTWSVHILSVKE